MKEKTAGILGGMGPEATIDLMRRILAATEAQDDADHVHCIVDNNPKIPSRIKALIEKTGESPAPCLADMARGLEAWGADFLCIPCNTAHHYYPDVQKAVRIPVLNMIELTAQAAARLVPGGLVGIAASPAVRLTALYDKPCAAHGLRVLYADAANEENLLRVIRQVKAGNTGAEVSAAFGRSLRHLAEQGADVLVVACTELGILDVPDGLRVLDAAQVLAQGVVDTAKGRMPRGC